MNHSQAFTSSGTFNVPTGVSCVLVTAIAGGGAGGWCGNFVAGFHGGGAGGLCYRRPYVVTPEGTVTVTIGAGGISVDLEYGLTGNGEDTTFGSLRVGGGQGAFHSDSGHGYGGVGGNAAGLAYEAAVSDGSLPFPHIPHGVLFYNPGFISTQNTYGWFGGSSGGTGGSGNVGRSGGASGNGSSGGVGGSVGTDGSGGGGGGGSSPWGQGGAGATRTGISGAPGHAPTAGHYGAGGGGGIGSDEFAVGGSGAPGYCLVEWFEKL